MKMVIEQPSIRRQSGDIEQRAFLEEHRKQSLQRSFMLPKVLLGRIVVNVVEPGVFTVEWV